MKKKNKAVWKCGFWMALSGCLLCVGLLGRNLLETRQTEKQYQLMKEIAAGETMAKAETGKETKGETEEQQRNSRIKNPIDFPALHRINEEICGWIQIPDTQIDAPVLQHQGEDTYYLSHRADGKEAFSGSIYIEQQNQKNFSDYHTVLYGHNMKNGTMFQNLHKFREKSFFDAHSRFYLYIPGHKLTYEVFAAYEFDDRHLLNSFDFRKGKIRKRYLKKVMSRYSRGGNVRSGCQVTAQDKILTLSTCVGGRAEARYLVQAVLRNDEKTEKTASVRVSAPFGRNRCSGRRRNFVAVRKISDAKGTAAGGCH